MHLLTLPPGLSTIMIVQDRTRDSVSTSRCYCFAPVLPSHEDGDVALTSNKRRPSLVLRRHAVNDC